MDIRKNMSNQEKSLAMPSMNNYSSRKEWEKACWQKMLESKELLSLLVSVHERHDLVMRAVAAESLFAGKSYRQIGKELWLSPQTISGIKKAVNEKEYKSYLERSKKERKKKQYGSKLASSKSSPKPSGVPHRTKYGKVYLPY